MYKISVAVCLVFFGMLCLAGAVAPAAEEEFNEEQFNLIVGFIGDPDRETRAVGLQYVREEMPGATATKKFAELLAKLSPEGQADLIDALGDRGDALAKPAVLKMLESLQTPVRTASLRALGLLGGAADVPLLSREAASASDAERKAARQSLIRLRGDDVNAAIDTALKAGDATIRTELLDVLAARNAKEFFSTVLENVKHADESVRLAALRALRFLAEEKDTASIVDTLKAAATDGERRLAELALLAICTRAKQSCAGVIVKGLEGAEPAARAALLRTLARAGGEEALKAVAAAVKDEDETVRNEAVRMLSAWSDPAVTSHLQELAKSDSLRHQVLAIRGLVRLAGPRETKPADVELLSKTMELAQRPQEKRYVLGGLGTADTSEAMALALAAMDNPELAEDAGLAVVRIAGKMVGGDADEIRSALEKVQEKTRTARIRQMAEQILQSL